MPSLRPLAAVLITFGANVATLLAGDLTPAAGPVSPTMLRLDEVEPRTPLGPSDLPIIITQPGSYFLTGNLLATGGGVTAVRVVADHVTLDLRGFMIGPSEVGVFDRGIVIEASNVSVANGTIQGSLFDGIYAALADDCAFTDIRASENGVTGILSLGDAVFHRCVVTDNTVHGIRCDSTAVVEGCRAEGNGSSGMQVGARSSVSGCTSTGNTGTGYIAGDSCSFANCVAYGNGSYGFFSNSAGGSFINCTARMNSTGFGVGSGVVVESCTANENTDDGISVSSGSIVRNCTARQNGRYGITMGFRSLITGNTCDANVVGIYTTQGVSRIDSNACTGGDRGIEISVGTSNWVVRNTCKVNVTDYLIAAGNEVGTITLTPVGAGAWDNHR